MYHTYKDYLVQELLKFELIYYSSLLIQTRILSYPLLSNCIKPLEYLYEIMNMFVKKMKIEKKICLKVVSILLAHSLLHTNELIY